jgi:putative exporter of polyketide antibiotics
MNALAGTGGLVRLALRRDRFLLPLWVVLIPLVLASVVSATEEVYPNAAARVAYAATAASNPTFLALYGPVYDTSLGGIIAERLGGLRVVVAVISLLLVIRHTRTEEDMGRRDLVGSAVVGRHAGLLSALVVAVAANLGLAALTALLMSAQGLPVAGSIALGLSFALPGCVFAGVAAVTAQLTESAGGARGIAFLVLGVAFVLRVAGDIGGGGDGSTWPSALSPLGWAQEVRSYGDERWWLFAVAAGVVVVLAAAAIMLSARRDVGAGVLPVRLGPAEAAPALRSPLALAWRLHRGLLFGWTIGLAFLGVVYGSLADSAEQMVEDSPQLRQVIEGLGGTGGMADLMLSTMLGIIAVIASAYAVQATLRMRTEETVERAEPLLATSVSRWRWAGSHLLFALLGPTIGMAVAGVTAGLAHGLRIGDVDGQLLRVAAGGVVQVPALWVLSGIAVAAFGLLPRLSAAFAWGAFALFLFLGQVGAMLRLDQWMLDVSPFTHVPRLPGGEFTATPVLVLLAITVALIAAGLAGFRRRDIG